MPHRAVTASVLILLAVIVFLLFYFYVPDDCSGDTKVILKSELQGKSRCFNVTEVEIFEVRPTEQMQSSIKLKYPNAKNLTLSHINAQITTPFDLLDTGFTNIKLQESKFKSHWFNNTEKIDTVEYIVYNSFAPASFVTIQQTFPNLKFLSIEGAVNPTIEGPFMNLTELRIKAPEATTITMNPKDFPNLQSFHLNAEKLTSIRFTSPPHFDVDILQLVNSVIDTELCQLLASPAVKIQKLGKNVSEVTCAAVDLGAIQSTLFSIISPSSLQSITIHETFVSQKDLDSFDKFVNLEKLNLSHNKLPATLTFNNLNLKELNLSFCDTFGMDINLHPSSTIRQIDATNTNVAFDSILKLAVSRVENVRFNCDNREEIDLSKRKITKIPEWLTAQCTTVTTLIISDNYGLDLSSITFSKLELLDIRRTGDQVFPAEVLAIKDVIFTESVSGVILNDYPTFSNFPSWFSELNILPSAVCKITSSAINLQNSRNLYQLSRFYDVEGVLQPGHNSRLSFAGLSKEEVSQIITSHFFAKIGYTSLEFHAVPDIPDAIWLNSRLLNSLQAIYFDQLPNKFPQWLLQKDVDRKSVV